MVYYSHMKINSELLFVKVKMYGWIDWDLYTKQVVAASDWTTTKVAAGNGTNFKPHEIMKYSHVLTIYIEYIEHHLFTRITKNIHTFIEKIYRNTNPKTIIIDSIIVVLIQFHRKTITKFKLKCSTTDILLLNATKIDCIWI